MATTQTTQAAEVLANKVVDAAVASADLPNMSKSSQADTKAALVKETEAVVMNQMNQEPWYQSRIIVTQYVTLLVTLGGIFGYVVAPELRDQIITAVLAVGAVITPLITLYARMFAKKPMTLFTGTGK